MAVRQLRPRRHRPDGHLCQPFADERPTGLRSDPRLPLKYQRDPWCWAPHLGFHRVSAPDSPALLRASPGQHLAGPDHIAPYQALRLGYGLGTSVGGGSISEFVHRFCELSHYVQFTDAELFAIFGHTARGYEPLRRTAGRRAVHRAAFRQAYRLMGDQTALLGPVWTDLLDRAATDLPLTSVETTWAAEQEREGPERRDRAAGRTFRALYDGGHGGDSRGLVQLFALTEPAEGRAAAWLRGVGTAIAAGTATALASAETAIS